MPDRLSGIFSRENRFERLIKMKVVIVGGVAGGASAAARLRRLDEQVQIIIFERTGFVSYANCGLPYYIGGKIKSKSALTLQTPQSFMSRFNIDVRVRHEVMSIDRHNKKVTVKNIQTNEVFEESYDKLVLSPGASAVRPGLAGIDSKKIYSLRTVEDTFRIRKAAVSADVKSAVIIGGGFIGVEMAENLSKLGLNVSIVERQPQLLVQFDADMASFMHSHIRSKSVNLLLGRSVSGFKEERNVITTEFEDGGSICADMVILSIGVSPESYLAKAAGLETGFRNSIAVNENMQTSDPDIYAVGDAVQTINPVTGAPAVVALAGPANKQGRIAADNICGLKTVYKGSVAASVLKVFDMTAASVGINESAAKAAGIDYEKVILSPASHASYYPGANVMTLKLIFEKGTERILGAQIAGFDGVDKRIDVISTAMQSGMKVTMLKELDLAYAPPYSSAKDPVNMAGFIAENVISGKVKQFFFDDIVKLDDNAQLVDTRTDTEYADGHADGFDIHIPVDDLRQRMDELDITRPVYVMCQSGLRSYIVCRILSQNGFDCYNFAGGYRLYSSIKNDRFDEKSSTSCGLEQPAAKVK